MDCPLCNDDDVDWDEAIAHLSNDHELSSWKILETLKQAVDKLGEEIGAYSFGPNNSPE